MLLKYIQTALENAHYEMIKDEEPFYGEVPLLAGVWATGETLEECRRNLAEAIEDWVLFSVAKGLGIPKFQPSISKFEFCSSNHNGTR